MARRLVGLIIIDGTDATNWPFSDEKVFRLHPVSTFLDVDHSASRIKIPDFSLGSGCRIEIDLTAKIEGRGEVQVEGTGRLFEGTTENTDDNKEDEKVFNFTVPRNTVSKPNQAFHKIKLRNRGIGRDDHAQVSIFLTNSIIEEY